MKRSFWVALALVLTLAATGCATIIPYEPKPASATAPEQQIKDALNLSAFPPIKVEIASTYLKLVNSSPDNGMTATVLVFSNLGAMKLEELSAGAGKYRVTVGNAGGGSVFYFETNDLGSAQRFIDAVAALRARAPKS